MKKELKELKEKYNKLLSKYVDLSYEYEELMLEKLHNKKLKKQFTN